MANLPGSGNGPRPEVQRVGARPALRGPPPCCGTAVRNFGAGLVVIDPASVAAAGDHSALLDRSPEQESVAGTDSMSADREDDADA